MQTLLTVNPSDPVGAKRITNCAGASAPRQACALGFYRGKASALQRFGIVHHNFPGTAPVFTDVFEYQPYSGGENLWGISCKQPYTAVLCGQKELAIDTSGQTTSDMYLEDNGIPGCYSDNEELAGPDPTISIKCCDFGN